VTVRTTPDPSNNDILDNDYMKIEELWSLYGETNGDDHIVNLQVVLKQQKTQRQPQGLKRGFLLRT